MNLKDFKVIDGRKLSGEELAGLFKKNGVDVKKIPIEEARPKKKKDKDKMKTFRPDKPLSDYTKEDTIVAKQCDIQEIYSDLDLIYDFNRDTVFMPNGSFTARHGAAVHSLAPFVSALDSLYTLDSLNEERMRGRKAAFEYVMNCVTPVSSIAKNNEIEETGGVYSYMQGNSYFMDEMVRARTIKEAYEYVMTAGDEEDMQEAQEMMDKYVSIFSDDLGVAFAYEPHEKREIPMDKRCEASKQRVFKQNDTVQLVVPNSWTTRRQSYKGEFDVIKFPPGFFIGEGASKVDLSGYSFNYTINPVATDDTNGGVYTLNDGLLKGYDFCYGSLLTLSRSVHNSLGTGWEKEYINAVSIKSLIEGIKEYAASKSDEFKVVRDESENTNTESCTTTKEMCR